ncbi:hypothetical protein [Pontibacter sp. HJ8]
MSDKQMKCWICALVLLLVAAWPAMGQISNKAVNRHAQLKRQSLREASHTDASFKDTHLNMDVYTFKKGEAGKADGRSFGQLFRSGQAPGKEAARQKPAVKEKKFRLFRKKNKAN